MNLSQMFLRFLIQSKTVSGRMSEEETCCDILTTQGTDIWGRGDGKKTEIKVLFIYSSGGYRGCLFPELRTCCSFRGYGQRFSVFDWFPSDSE